MKTVNVSELAGAALDWAVAKCEEKHVWTTERLDGIELKDTSYEKYSPSSDWLLAGPIIEREGITIERFKSEPKWSAFNFATGDCEVAADSPLIAAMRCYVASKFGDTIEIPDVLEDE